MVHDDQHSRPLRVALPMVNLVPGGMGGSETYVSKLAGRLEAREDIDVAVGLASSAAEFSEVRRVAVGRWVGGGETPLARFSSQAAAELSPALRELVAGADVVHYPLTVPSPHPQRHRPYVQTLHDTQHHDMAHNFANADHWYRRLRYDAPARRANAVITVSEFCKGQITSHLGVAPDRVHVAHLGVDTDEFTPHTGERAPFVLYPARGWPHKNHARLVEAMHLVRQTRPDLRLVLTGGGLDSLGDLPSWVELRGLVSRAELLDLYRAATCLAFPSLYEGFGLPPLEAMASGCPVAASEAGSLAEVCGDAAVLFDPLAPRSIADAIVDAASASSSSLRERGLVRVRDFTWERCADTHVEVYRAVAEEHRSRRQP